MQWLSKEEAEELKLLKFRMFADRPKRPIEYERYKELTTNRKRLRPS